MRKNITWPYREAFCMSERSEGAKGGAGVAKKPAKRDQSSSDTFLYCSKCTQAEPDSDITTAKWEHLCLPPGLHS